MHNDKEAEIMIEEIKLLLPLLEKASDGAINLVYLYFGYNAFTAILTCSILAVLILGAYRLIKYSILNESIIERIHKSFNIRYSDINPLVTKWIDQEKKERDQK